MSDFYLALDAEALVFDLAPAEGAAPLAEDSGLRTAVLASLFTWRRADDDDALPDPRSTDRRGYWGDTFSPVSGRRIGCRWWLHARSVLTTEVIEDMRQMGIEALTWLVDDGVVAAFDFRLERAEARRLNIGVTFHRFDGSTVDLDFGDVWQDVLEVQ